METHPHFSIGGNMFLIVGTIYFLSVVLAWVTVNGWAFVLSIVSGALTVFWVVCDAD